MVLIELEKCTAEKMFAYLLNKNKKRSLPITTPGLDRSSTVMCNYKSPSSRCLCNSENVEHMHNCVFCENVNDQIFATDLDYLKNFLLRRINEILMNSDAIWLHRLTLIDVNKKLQTLLQYDTSSCIIRLRSNEQCSPHNICFILTTQSRNEKILRDTFIPSVRQTDIMKVGNGFTTTDGAFGVIFKIQYNNDMVQSKLLGTKVFEDPLSTEHKDDDSCIVNFALILQQDSFLNSLKRRRNQLALENIFHERISIDASTSYRMKFTDVVGILLTTALPKRILVTPSGKLTSDTVVAGKREKHFSQAFLNYISPDYSKKYTSSSSKAMSIAGAVVAIKGFLRRKKDEYRAKKLANEKKRKALEIGNTSHYYTSTYDPFDRYGYSCYCY